MLFGVVCIHLLYYLLLNMRKITKWRLCEGAILAREPRMLLVVDDRAKLRTYNFLDAHPLLLVVHWLGRYGGKLRVVELHW